MFRILKPRKALTDAELERIRQRAEPLSTYGRRAFDRYIDLRQGVRDAIRQADRVAYNSLSKELEEQRCTLDWLASRTQS